VKRSRTQARANVHSVPSVRFEAQNLTPYGGLVLLQLLLGRLDLKSRLRTCFAHRRGATAFGHELLFLVLVVHLWLGHRRLRDIEYYREDRMVKHVLGLRVLPDVSTLSRSLKAADERTAVQVRGLLSSVVVDRLAQEQLARVTLDFDGSVLSTRRRAEGTAVGFNRKRKGDRSYYPLLCTVAQTGQILDVHHRSGNVHDSNGAPAFIRSCVQRVRKPLRRARIEARMDSAFFSKDLLLALGEDRVEFTASVPFERLVDLKRLIEERRRWTEIDPEWSFFEPMYRPKSWPKGLRFICIRQITAERRKAPVVPVQRDLFEPRDPIALYSVVVTNKTESGRSVIEFHHGRGSQEKIFAEAKSHAQFDYIPVRGLYGNQLFGLASLFAHNLNRELQMACRERTRRIEPKRPALWNFLTLRTFRSRFLVRAARIIRPKNKLTLVLNANEEVEKEFRSYLQALEKAA
jgi:hypothetical protein